MNGPQPTLTTKRLLLRPFGLEDAAAVRTLAGDRDVSSTTANLPHPYGEGIAEAWISTHRKKYQEGTEVIFAVRLKKRGELIGAIGLIIDQAGAGAGAEMGYWIGKPFWRKGFATEAASAILEYGFNTLQLATIRAHHMLRNPASGRVLEKIGMTPNPGTGRIVRASGETEEVQGYSVHADGLGFRTCQPGPRGTGFEGPAP